MIYGLQGVITADGVIMINIVYVTLSQALNVFLCLEGEGGGGSFKLSETRVLLHTLGSTVWQF